MKNCKTCGQGLPKQTPKAKDFVLRSNNDLGMVLADTLAALLTVRYAPPVFGYVRVLALTGPSAGLTTQWPVSQLTVVKGNFRVTERL